MHRLFESERVPDGQSRGYRQGALDLVVVRRAGQLHGYRNHCPHRGVTLNWQADRVLDDSGSLIQCAHHGALFLVDSGECVVGPCAGAFLQRVPLIEREGAVWLAESTD